MEYFSHKYLSHVDKKLQKAEAEESGSSATYKFIKILLFASLCRIKRMLPAES